MESNSLTEEFSKKTTYDDVLDPSPNAWGSMTYPASDCQIIIQKYIQSSIQPSKRNRENDMSLLQDERLVSNRLKKSEQIVNVEK